MWLLILAPWSLVLSLPFLLDFSFDFESDEVILEILSLDDLELLSCFFRLFPIWIKGNLIPPDDDEVEGGVVVILVEPIMVVFESPAKSDWLA